VVAGVALWASFPPLNWWWAGPLGVAGLTLVVRGVPRCRQAALLGLLSGLGLWVPLLYFLRGYGIDAWLVVAVIESLWWALTGVASALVQRHRCWPVGIALVWVLQEFLRDRVPFHGFPWGRLAFGQSSGPLLPLAALGGAPLVSGTVAALGAMAAYLYVDLTRRRLVVVQLRRLVDWWRPAAVLLLGAAVLTCPFAVSLPDAGTTAGGAASAVIAVVQGNVPRLGLDEFAQKRAVTANHLAETQRLAQAVAAGRVPQPDVVVWPENSSDEDPFSDPTSYAMISQAVQAIAAPIVVGAVLRGPGAHHVRNTAIVWSPTTGPGQTYVKRHLVPFGEYLPGRRVLSAVIGRFRLLPNDFVAGHRPGVLDAAGVRLADAICFEVADDGVVRQAVTAGGRVIAVQTNNASYEQIGDSGRGGETAQQLAMTRLRAVEHGRAAVVAATSGVSAVISPDGKVLSRTGVFTAGFLDARVPLRDPLTVADRLGPWPERGAAAIAAIWLGICLPRPRRRSSVPPSKPSLTGTSISGVDLDSRPIPTARV
jgi:apolipoprotein N-acyltransferase